MEKYKEECPVCGNNSLNVTRYSEYGIGIVEIHGYCSNCTYREEMCYSKPLSFICETDTEEHKKKSQELGIKILQESVYEQIG